MPTTEYNSEIPLWNTLMKVLDTFMDERRIKSFLKNISQEEYEQLKNHDFFTEQSFDHLFGGLTKQEQFAKKQLMENPTHVVYDTTGYNGNTRDYFTNPEIKGEGEFYFSVNGTMYPVGQFRIKEL